MRRREQEREKQLLENKQRAQQEFDVYVNMIERVFSAAPKGKRPEANPSFMS
jgi:hypothetical protein